MPALSHKPQRVQNPPNPYIPSQVEWDQLPPLASQEIYEEHCKSIIAKNDSPDISFSYSINPYRGCFHGCAYCYARPSHHYLDFGAGSDFERKIIVKTNAALQLRKEFMARSWKGEQVVFSGNTDCYQPLELNYQLTRSCLEVCLDFRNPVGIITKGAIIQRDLDLLIKLNQVTSLQVFISLAFFDDHNSTKLEPGAPRPSARIRAIRTLADAGISVGVGLAPIIPALNDSEIADILEAAYAAGARKAFITLLRLPKPVDQVFSERLKAAFPTKAEKVLAQLRDMKGGALNRAQFGKRMHGDGPRWQAIKWVFDQHCQKLGMNRNASKLKQIQPFRRPNRQLSFLE